MGTTAEPRQAHARLPDRYRPIRPIATGGMAAVWCAEDLLLGRRVAIKLLADPYAGDLNAVRRFKREARAAAHLSGHPHVVTIYDVGDAIDGTAPDRPAVRPFLVMEHLSGGTVADALRVGEVTPDDAVRWLHEAASAIDYAHASGILHRDIKPANLLLDRHRRLHVADFGIAQFGGEETLTGSGQVLGTASYLPPERALGRPATRASDLYSLAVVAFELLTGQRPFSATAYLAQARQHLEQEPPAASSLTPRLPPALDAVLARGMAKEPERRWPSAQAFALAISDAYQPAIEATSIRAAAVARGRRAVGHARPGAGRGARTRHRGAGDRERQTVLAAPLAQAHRAPAPAAPLAQARRPTPPGPAMAPTRRWRPYGLLAGALASLALMAVGLAWAAQGSKPRRASVHRPATTATVTGSQGRSATASVRHPARHHPAPPRPRSAATVTGVPAASTTPVPTADTLEARGHALLNAGQYAAAIPVLRSAVAAAAPGSLTRAYALFDLGRALRLSGDPKAAIPVLLERLKFPNQTGVVRTELALAIRAASGAPAGTSGGAPAPSGGVAPGPGGGPREHHGHGPKDKTAG